MGQIALNKEEIKLLKKIHKYTYNNSMRENRIKAVLLYNKDMSKTEIKEILLLDLQTIRRYINDFINHGMESIDFEDRRKSKSGNRREITKKQEEKISDYVHENIISDAKEVQEYIRKIFNVEYSISGVTKLLHDLGFVYKKVIVIPQKNNTPKAIEKQLIFEQNYEAFKKSLDRDDTILFLDGVHPTHNTKAGYAWTQKGEENIIESNTGRERVNINGAYNALNGDVIAMKSDTVNSDSTIKLFDKIIESYSDTKGDLYCFSDNAKYYKSYVLQDALKTEKYKRIKMIFIPPYSPNLNPIERVWKFFKREVLTNKFYSTFTAFDEAIDYFFDTTMKQDKFKERVRHFASDHFHIRRIVHLAMPVVEPFQTNYFGK